MKVVAVVDDERMITPLEYGNTEYNETGKERTYVWWNAGSCNELPYVMREPIKRHF